jgi:hypothetical protein
MAQPSTPAILSEWRWVIPVDDPQRPLLDEAARRAFVQHYRTGLLLPGAQR